MQTGNHAELYIYACFPAYKKNSETWTHRRFASFRERGEWFALEYELSDFANLVRWIDIQRPCGFASTPAGMRECPGAYNVHFVPPDLVP